MKIIIHLKIQQINQMNQQQFLMPAMVDKMVDTLVKQDSIV